MIYTRYYEHCYGCGEYVFQCRCTGGLEEAIKISLKWKGTPNAS